LADQVNPQTDLDKAALRGEPSYVWRAGQERRLAMIRRAAGERTQGRILDNGCGVGSYLLRLKDEASTAFGLEFDFERAQEADRQAGNVVQAAGEGLPYPDETFDLVLSHEVLEHVENDRQAASEMARVLQAGGRLVLFLPNRGYPFETHGVYWRGKYRFGNIPLVNYLPRRLRNRLAPHVRVYSKRDIKRIFIDLPLRPVLCTVIFGAYDNLIARWPRGGRVLRTLLQLLERTPLRSLGLSHFWILEKYETPQS
jgi:SAM-dependent methyltransferase